MKLICLPVGFLQENTYIYYDEQTMDGVVIDPGDEGVRIQALLVERGIRLVAILLTHGHFDHVGAVNELKAKPHAPVYIGLHEAAFLADPLLNGSATIARRGFSVQADHTLADGEKAPVLGHRLAAIHTQGHTHGSVCYYDQEAGILFAGDTLFYRSVGRTDLPTGNMSELADSIRNKLFTLPEHVAVYPGHGDETTIGDEKEKNPYVR